MHPGWNKFSYFCHSIFHKSKTKIICRPISTISSTEVSLLLDLCQIYFAPALISIKPAQLIFSKKHSQIKVILQSKSIVNENPDCKLKRRRESERRESRESSFTSVFRPRARELRRTVGKNAIKKENRNLWNWSYNGKGIKKIRRRKKWICITGCISRSLT